jgi:lipopolysaccharide transport system permease protein
MKDVYGNLWRWRGLGVDLAWREVRARYAGSMIGATWAVIEPLVQFGLYMTVFAYFLGTRIEGDPRVGAYAMYLVSGLVPFLALQDALVRAAGFARASASLVRHVSVPLEVLFFGAFLAILFRHGVALGIVLAAAVAAGTLAPVNLPFLVAGVILLLALAWGLGLALVVSGAILPDLAQIVSTGTMVLFFLTPVLYPASMIPAPVARWLALNPVVGVLDLFRSALTGAKLAQLPLVATSVAAAACLIGGGVVFSRRAMSARDMV